VEAWLAENNKKLAGILVTHHHWDHTDGVQELLSASPKGEQIPVYGPGKSPLAYTTRPLFEGDKVDIGWLEFKILELPGHTQNHIVYFAQPANAAPLLFSGDVLFSAGCGRLKDGTAEQLYDSLQRLKQLPEETLLYCGHEYTLANLRFALSVEPDNQNALDYLHLCQELVQKDAMTLPSSIGLEKLVNPFMRTDSSTVNLSCEKHFGTAPQNSVDCFAALRKWKDNFA
jgi:hydroxyacylglutathione hydrolase